ncbi:uncharacterized protein LOC142227126 [Haematobia irritans]|uniref:uncharacterized protein LOC142227126 n=1 Tax=Haematobia irritans TaxID=7368 RepID=UPI003F4FCDE7
MERKSQNFKFVAKLSESNEKVHNFERPSSCLVLSNNRTALEDDAPSNVEDLKIKIRTSPCSIKCPSYQHTSYDDIYDGGGTETSLGSCESEYSETISSNALASKRHLNTKLRNELLKYKEELKQYKDTAKDLENKYLKINLELGEMQQKHDAFMDQRNGGEEESNGDGNSWSGNSRSSSAISLERKSTQIFHRGSSCRRVVPSESQQHFTMGRRVHSSRTFIENENQSNDEPKRYPLRSKENIPPKDFPSNRCRNYDKSLKSSRENITSRARKSLDVDLLQTTIENLESEKVQYRNIIEQQQNSLHDYHERCTKAQRVMKSQQNEIEKLNSNNQHLESELNRGIEQLRHRIESKIRELSQLPQMMREEQLKNEKILKENIHLSERIRSIQNEANQMKKKIEEINRRKATTMARLKTAEKDLKIFKNYNIALKHEKRKLNEDLQKLRDQMSTMDLSNKRNINRQREHNEKQKRDLQKRIFELEMKLSRSQTSTSSLVQERDTLIAELQSQLNTLVHNFEVSQKHIRILRRHIYSMSGGNSRDAVARNRVLVETAC